jgi:hypothetical protein
MKQLFLLTVLSGLAACNVTAAKPTGGAELPSRGECPRGLAVVTSDYISSEIALLAPDGEVRSAAFMSSASTEASGLAAPFSGDIGVSSAPFHPGELVIVDRFGTNVLTFVNTESAEVRAQLPVGTGFEANAQDYLELEAGLAFVPRLGQNRAPGLEPFDAGSDVLVIDPSEPRIVSSLPMPVKQGYRPSPSALMRLRGDVLVTLDHARANFSGSAEGEIVAISGENLELRYRLPLSGLVNCGQAKLSPGAERLAVACSGHLDRTGAVAEPETSGIVLFDPAYDPPREVERFAALDVLGSPLQSSLEFVTERLVLIKSQTPRGAELDNRLFVLDLRTGEAELLETAARDASGKGIGVAFAGMSCRAECGDPCLVADLSRGKLLRFHLRDGRLERGADVAIDGAGLPPLSITQLY